MEVAIDHPIMIRRAATLCAPAFTRLPAAQWQREVKSTKRKSGDRLHRKMEKLRRQVGTGNQTRKKGRTHGGGVSRPHKARNKNCKSILNLAATRSKKGREGESKNNKHPSVA